MSTVHGTFTITRELPHAPERVYAAWSDPAAKAAKYEMADKYERLAARAREWVDRADIPRFIKSPPTAL